jgi:hypothetical protein
MIAMLSDLVRDIVDGDDAVEQGDDYEDEKSEGEIV